jgi:hypothetical protein
MTRSAGHGGGWYAAVTAGAVAAVVAVVLGVLALTGRGPEGGGDAAGPAGSTATSSSAGTPAQSSVPTAQPRTTASGTPTPPVTPSVGNDVVSVSAQAAAHPLTPTVVDVVTRYVQSINDKDFVTYQSLFTAGMRAKLDTASLARGYRSTQDSEVQLVQVGESGDGRTAASIRFVSTQDAADGPDGQTCTVWAVVLFLQPEAGRLVIGAPPADYRGQYRTC